MIPWFIRHRIGRPYYFLKNSFYDKARYLIFGIPFIPYHISYLLLKRYASSLRGKSVLDAGCGEGALLNQLAIDYNVRGLGIDIRENRIHEAQMVANHYSLPVTYEINDIQTYKNQEKYDTILLFDVLEHVSNPSECVKVLKNSLNQTGELYIRVPYGQDSKYFKLKESFAYGDDHHKRSGFTEESLTEILEDAGFTIRLYKKHYHKLSEFLYEIIELVRQRSNILNGIIVPLVYPLFLIEFIIEYENDPHGLFVIAKRS